VQDNCLVEDVSQFHWPVYLFLNKIVVLKEN